MVLQYSSLQIENLSKPKFYLENRWHEKLLRDGATAKIQNIFHAMSTLNQNCTNSNQFTTYLLRQLNDKLLY